MIPQETITRIRHLFHAEHWKIGTIASELGVHHDTVRRALQTERFRRSKNARSSLLDPYAAFIQETLTRYPRLRATRIFQMIAARGYAGGISSLRRLVADLRPSYREAFLRLRTFPGEQAQADWAHFGKVKIGRAERRLSCFVLTLSHSRALYLEFFFDQTLENFLRGHVHAFRDWGGVPRIILTDNLRSAVLERYGDAVRFHPRLLELCAHYHFIVRPCQVGRGNEKGRVERAIQFVRGSFFAARPFTTIEDFNRQARVWRDEVAHCRPWPGDDRRTVKQVFDEEKTRLLLLPLHPFDTDLAVNIRSGKTHYLRFDLNDYSIPPASVGRPLTLVASDTLIRILDGSREIARHNRSWDRHTIILDPAHEEELLAEKRKAFGSTPGGRLALAVPESEQLINAAFQKGEHAGLQTNQLLNLLREYGAQELRKAIQEALDRNTPRASSVAFILRRRARLNPGPAPIQLPRRPDLADLDVEPQNPETYDDLAKPDNDE
jgi:transposase